MSKQALSCSVVIVTYKRPSQLCKCLEGLSAQTIMPSEVLVVWQESDTATRDVANSIASSLPLQLRLLYSPIAGIVPAENVGLAGATGEIILMLDDDSVPPERWIESHLRHYSNRCVGAVGGPSRNHKPDGTPFPSRCAKRFGAITWYGKLIGNLFDHHSSYTGLIEVTHLAGGNMSLRRSAFTMFEPTLKPYWQFFEADACLQVIRRGYRVLYDFDNPVLHVPTSHIFDGTRNGDLERKVFNPAFNHAYLLSKHSPVRLRLVRLMYLLAVGSAYVPGLAAFPIAVKRYGSPLREVRLLGGSMRAHIAGWSAGRRVRLLDHAVDVLRVSRTEGTS